MVVHLAGFPLGMSAEMDEDGRLSGAWGIAIIFPFESYTTMSIRVSKETTVLVQSITMDPVDIITWLQLAHLQPLVEVSWFGGLGSLLCCGPSSFQGFMGLHLLLLVGVGNLCWWYKLLRGYEGRGKALHSHSSNFPGHWALSQQKVVFRSSSFCCLVHINHPLWSAEMTKNKCNKM